MDGVVKHQIDLNLHPDSSFPHNNLPYSIVVQRLGEMRDNQIQQLLRKDPVLSLSPERRDRLMLNHSSITPYRR
jgi:hypothetical protein